MNIEKSSSQTQEGYESTSSTREQLLAALERDEEYRQAFIEESIRMRVTAQIKALRDSKQMDYRRFAEALNKKVAWAYRLEDPNEPPPTIPSLLQVAATFDVGLDVRFRAFSEILDDVSTLTPASFVVPSFREEQGRGSFLRVKHRRKVRSSAHRRRPNRTMSPLEEPSEAIYIGTSNPRPSVAA
jgi:transcriptional regulator with XRE-family HTH domain